MNNSNTMFALPDVWVLWIPHLGEVTITNVCNKEKLRGYILEPPSGMNEEL